jgi:hypothetical protein
MSVFNVLVGKRINGLFLGDDDWALVFRDINERYYCFRTENDCCNQVWFNHVNGVETVLGEGNLFDILRGAMVTGVEDKGWTEDRADGYDVIQDAFWTIKTDRGYLDLEVRNSHNGYYGGSVKYDEESKIDAISGLRAVTADF